MNTVEPVQTGQRSAARGISLRFGTIAVVLSIVVLAVGLGVAGSSLWVSSDFKRSSQDSATLMSAMRNQVTADMYHDTLRGVVFRAMYAAVNNDAAMVKDAKAELDEYSGDFRAAIDAQKPLDLPPDVRAAIDGLSAPLDDYITGAAGVIDKAVAGDVPGATAALPGFDQKFKALEGKMSAASDAIEAYNSELTERSVSVARSADIANWSGVAATLILVAAMILLSPPLCVAAAGRRHFGAGQAVGGRSRRRGQPQAGHPGNRRHQRRRRSVPRRAVEPAGAGPDRRPGGGDQRPAGWSRPAPSTAS